MTDRIFYKWHPIEDLPSNPHSLEKAELRSLAAVWDEQRQVLEDTESLQIFNERLRREWSIETGLLERIYTFDRGITETLIENGIDAALIPHTDKDPNLVAAILRDHKEVIEGLFTFVKGERQLGTSYIKELHAVLTRHQDTCTAKNALGRHVEVELIKGDYKRLPNNPTREDGSIHEFCPPEHVAAEMDRLLELHEAHSLAGVSPEVEGAWLHHRFTQIHPFQDGNGRVARCLATIVLIRAGWFPLVVRDTDLEKKRYLDALEAADRGDIHQIISLFVELQKRAFVHALGISGQMRDRAKPKPEQIITATGKQLAEREKARRNEWEYAKDTAHRLQTIGEARLEEIAERLTTEIREHFPRARFFVINEPSTGTRGHYFRGQINEIAKQLNYYANPSEYRAWTRLVLTTDRRSEILLSYHSVGHEYRGVLAVSGAFFVRSQTEDGENEVVGLATLSDEIFQINYKEIEADAEKRFREWLEEALIKGLEMWRASI